MPFDFSIKKCFNKVGGGVMLEKKYIDLHCHSCYSDGTLTPEQLVLLGIEQGLSALALTDHDTIDGLADFHSAGKQYGLETISGIEYGTLYLHGKKRTEIHIVGLDFDENSPAILEQMKFLLQAREDRNKKMADKISSLGFPITLEEVEHNAGGDIITRAHFANVMVEKGYLSSRAEVFQKYLSPGLPAYVEREFLTPEECIHSIKAAGGVAILAHPTLYNLDFGEIKVLCRMLKKLGLDGIEGQYSTYVGNQAKKIRKIATSIDLALSGGSDFHGQNKPDIQLGCGKGNLKIPYSYLEELRRRK